MTTALLTAPRHNRRVAEAEQKNFHLPADLKRHFEAWADEKGYSDVKAFVAGFVALAAMSAVERERLFALVSEWGRGAYKPKVDSIVDRLKPTEGESPPASQRARSA